MPEHHKPAPSPGQIAWQVPWQVPVAVDDVAEEGQHFHLAADATFGTDIGGAGVAPAVRAEIGLGLDERARVGDDVENALIECLGGNRLGEH